MKKINMKVCLVDSAIGTCIANLSPGAEESIFVDRAYFRCNAAKHISAVRKTMRASIASIGVLICSNGFAAGLYTLKKYAEVKAQKPTTDQEKVKVWTVRQTDAIRINLVEFKGELPLHRHPDAEHSLLLLDGAVRVQVGDEKFVVNKGDFISVPANLPHKYWTISETAMLVSMDAPYYDPKKTVVME